MPEYKPDDKVYLWRFIHGPFIKDGENGEPDTYYAVALVAVNDPFSELFEEEFYSEDGRDFVEIQEYLDNQTGVSPYLLPEGWVYDER